MPTKSFSRLWCKTCQDWKLFEAVINDGEKCQVCGREHEIVLLGEIPKNKIAEQRGRFRAERKRNFDAVFSVLTVMSGNFGYDPGVRVSESDAGLLVEEQLEREEYDRRKKAKLDLQAQFKDVGRNDVCLCGSGKKFKKCCYGKVNS